MRKYLLFALITDIVLLSRLHLIIEGNYSEMLIRDKDDDGDGCATLGSRLKIKYLQIPQGEIIPAGFAQQPDNRRLMIITLVCLVQ